MKCTSAALALAGLFSLGLAAPALAQERRATPDYIVYGSPADPGDAAAIDRFYDSFVDAWAREDTAALIALHADDVEWINAFGRVIRGAPALEAFMRERMFPAFDQAVSKADAAAMTRISTRYLGDDAAVLHFYTRSPRGVARDGSEEPRLTYVHAVLEKVDGDWKFAHVAIMDAR